MHNVSLKKYSNLRIGGTAKAVYIPQNQEQLLTLVKKHPKSPIIAGGSNTLISDKVHEEIILLSKTFFPPFTSDEKTIMVSAPERISDLISFYKKNEFGGIEFMAGVPRVTIGGAVFQNFGAYGKSISEIIVSVDAIIDGKITTLTKEQCDFSYRSSIFKKNTYPIVSCQLKKERLPKEKFTKLIQQNIQKRKKTNPYNYPNIGCIFKNPLNNSAGKLIDEAGLRGFSIGGAKVWEEHANFLINTENATYEDSIKLIKHIQKVVKSKYNVSLETEITIIQ